MQAYPSPVALLGMDLTQARAVLQQAVALLKQEAHNAQLESNGELIDACDIIADLNHIETALYWEYERTSFGGIPRDAQAVA